MSLLSSVRTEAANQIARQATVIRRLTPVCILAIALIYGPLAVEAELPWWGNVITLPAVLLSVAAVNLLASGLLFRLSDIIYPQTPPASMTDP